MRTVLVLLCALVASPCPAQDVVGGAKSPAPPLFPRHGRGIYRNAAGEEVVDATPQSPPLVTDDPSVPEPGTYEINLLTQIDSTHSAQRADLLLADVNYGVRPSLFGYQLPTQLKLEVPLSAARAEHQALETGLGMAAVGVKVKFYHDEHRGISASVYPQLEFPTPGAHAVAKGLSDAGAAVVLPLLVAREFHECTVVFNGGVEKPVHDADRAATSEFGIAFGRALTRKDAIMAELRTESNLDFRSDRLVFVNGGYIHGVRHIVLYANIGHSVYSDARIGHTYGGVGIKLQLDPRRRAA